MGGRQYNVDEQQSLGEVKVIDYGKGTGNLII
jgi:hypothetical protein